MSREPLDDAALNRLERDTFQYFIRETNPATGLVADSTREGSASSITAVGLGLAAYIVGAERKWMTRSEAAERVLVTLRFFFQSPQSQEADATGYRGFYYHFLDMETGRRAFGCELSTIDTTFLLAGMLAAAAYFDLEVEAEREIRRLTDALYRRVDWTWAQNAGLTVTHGWTPEGGFLEYRWEGYDEALLLYVLGLGSPTHPLPQASYAAWTRTYQLQTIYGQEMLHAGPLFIHQLSHVWIDFRGIQDDYMRQRGSDYFENSRRATLAQQQYAIHNPKNFVGYNQHCWGITASDGPGPITRQINGLERQFYDYVARGIPNGPDDGTIAPWAAVASLPFAPEIVLPTIQHFLDHPRLMSHYGLRCSFNPTFTDGARAAHGWHSQRYYGLDQGPIMLMLENYRSSFLWKLMRRCSALSSGLQRAGFSGGWLTNQ